MKIPARLAELVKGNPLLAAALFLFFAAYSNSLGNAFQRDDIPHISANAAVADGSALRGLFSRDYFQLAGAVAYRPAVTALRVAEFRLFGADPRPWRFVNLLLHAVNAALLALIFLEVTGSPAAAVIGAALFLLHPVQTETLNYISNGQCDLLCLFFLCLSFLAWLRGRTAWALAAFCLALLSKEMALAFPLLLAAYALYKGELSSKWRFPAILAGVSLAFLLWRLFYFRAGPGFLDSAQAEAAYSFSLSSMIPALFRAPALAAYYVKLLVWPSGLSADIDRILPGTWLFSMPGLLLAWLTAATAAILLAAAGRRNKAWLLLPGLFLIALLPVSGLVAPTSLLQEHFVYIPSVFFCLSVGLAGSGMLNMRRGSLVWPALLMILIGYLFIIRPRNQDWANPLSLARSDVRNFPGSPAALAELAAQLKASGDGRGALGAALEAIKAGAVDGQPYLLAAEIYVNEGQPDKAVETARAGLEKDKGPNAMVNAARILARAGRGGEAAALAAEAVSAYPYFEPAFLTRGDLLLKDKPCEAEKMFREALRLNARSRAAERMASPRPPCPGNI